MSKANEFVELVETLEEGAAWDATKRAAKSVGNFAKEMGSGMADDILRRGWTKEDLEQAYQTKGYSDIRDNYLEIKDRIKKAKEAGDNRNVRYFTAILNRYAILVNYALKREEQSQSDQDFKYRRYQKDVSTGDPKAQYAAKYKDGTRDIVNKNNVDKLKVSGGSKASKVRNAFGLL